MSVNTFASTATDTSIRLADKDKIVLTSEEREWLKQNPHIKLIALVDQPPFSMKDHDGRHIGIMQELFGYLGSSIGQELEFKLVKASATMHDRAKEEGVYGHGSVFKTPQLQNKYRLSDPYLSTPFYLYTTRNNLASFKQVNDLKGKKVAVIKGHRAQEEYLNNIGGVKVVFVDTPLEQMQKVSSGEADAMVGYFTYPHLTNKFLMVDLAIAYISKPEMGIRVGVNPEHPILQRILNKAIATLSEKQKNDVLARWTQISRDESPQIELTKKERAWLADNPVIRLGNSVDWQPIGFINEQGIYSGMAADYMNYIGQFLGVRIEPSKLSSWRENVAAARAGELDMLDAAVPTPQRREFLTFTRPYLSYPLVIVTGSEVKYIADMEGLHGKRVAVIAGSAAHDLLASNHPNVDLVPLPNIKAGLLAVAGNAVNAYIGDLVTVSHAMGQEGLTNIKISGEAPYRYDLSVAIQKDKPILASVIQKALDAIPKEKRNDISRKWLSVTFEHKTDYTIIYQILVFVALVLIAFLYWNRRLSREVSQRKHVEVALRSAHDDLKISYEHLAESELWQRGIYDALEEGVLVATPDRLMVDMNPACQAILGYSQEEIVGQQTSIVHVDDEHVVKFGKRIKESFDKGEVARFEFELKRKNGEVFPTEHNVSLIKNNTGEAIGIVSTLRDITVRKQTETELRHHREHLEKLVTERTIELEKLNEQLQLEIFEHKQAEVELRTSRRDLRAIFDNMQDVFYQADTEGRIIMLSPSAEKLMQYTVEELMGQKLADFYVDPDGREKFLKALEEGGGSVQGYEAVVKRKDGSHVWISTNAHIIFDDEGDTKGVEGTIRDITERKKAEHALRDSRESLRKLAKHLEDVRESERAGIAREIHDELGQALLALNFDLQWMNKRVTDTDKDERLSEKLRSMLQLVNSTVDTVQRISSELRPSLLKDLGLEAAINWYVEEYQDRTSIKCNASIELNDVELDMKVSTAVFRIIQEALTNVGRHSAANEVSIDLVATQQGLVLEITDNGKGIDEKKITESNSFGLMGMRERTMVLGGSFDIKGVKKEGTTIRLTIPLTECEIVEA